MSRRAVTFDGVSVMQIAVAVFLFTFGLIGIIDGNSSIAQFGADVIILLALWLINRKYA